ncbi:MAG: hypothetical protein WC906_03730, partial [Parcubacteria group bacterium]
SLLAMGKTHLNRSSLIVFGILIHILQDNSILEKPPYVCGHYLSPLTESPMESMIKAIERESSRT